MQAEDFWIVILRKNNTIDELNYKLVLANEELDFLKKQLKARGGTVPKFKATTSKPLPTKCYAKDQVYNCTT